jgi:TolA-binding protein
MRNSLFRVLSLCVLLFALATASASAQTPAPSTGDGSKPASASSPGGALAGNLFGLDEMQRQLREQREQLEQMRSALKEQARLIEELRGRMERAEQTHARGGTSPAVISEAAFTTSAPADARGDGDSTVRRGAATETTARQEGTAIEGRVGRVEEQARKTSEALSKQLGSMTFGGDLRVGYEATSGQQNALATSGDTTGALGNPLTIRNRLRMRLRFGVRGQISKELEWGLRLSTGSLAEPNSPKHTLTDFFNRKTFALDQAFLAYRPSALPGFSVQAGKFDTPWLRTEMTWDNDISIEGLNENYTRSFKGSPLKEVAFVAWQAPFLERNSAFVLGADGNVDLEESGRAGRDLALFGAQLRARLSLSKQASLTLSAADLYFSGTQFINPAQFLGPNLLLPVTFTIPASGTTPARNVITQVSIPRDLLVSGNGNLGFSSATTNALNRDGRLASGYNLVDLIARLDLSHSKRWPLMLLFNYVTNTQVHDVVSAGPGGANVLQHNGENDGYWAEVQVGKDVFRLPVKEVNGGDMSFNYAFIRIEKDAVLTPFNYSDISIFSDVRVHRFVAAYAPAPRVVLSLTGFFSARPNGILGPFGATPPGSLNSSIKRLQLDTTLRF